LAFFACNAGDSAAQPAPPRTIDVPGDHYQCYRVRGVAPNEPITVADQFGRAQIVVAHPVMLCNPSLKIHREKRYPPKSPDLHLVCYEPAKVEKPRTHRVRIGNQFQIADLIVAERIMFCVPSRKRLLDEHPAPLG
jgi:hypothetical protein